MISVAEAKTILNELISTYNGALPEITSKCNAALPVNTEVIYLISDNGDVAFYKVGGNELTSSLKEKLIKKWNELGKPLAMTVRNNTKLERARVLNAMFDGNTSTDVVQMCVDVLKSQAHVDADENELGEAISGMHASRYGKHISILPIGYELVYSKSADMYDGRITFQLTDLIPKVFFDIADTEGFHAMPLGINQNDPAPEEETFDFTDEALKEMKELGGLA